MKDHGSEQEAYSFGTTINCTGEPASLALEMEVQIKAQEVFKDVASYSSNRFLRNTCKYSIAELLKYGSTDPCSPI